MQRSRLDPLAKIAGITSIASGKEYTCIKFGKKLIWNKGVSLVVIPIPTPSPPPTFNESYVDSSGIYTGIKSWQGLDWDATIPLTCPRTGSLPVTITLLETGGGKITGNDGRISGTREGNTITVTVQTEWGVRGPYTWQLNGKTITGSWHVTCFDDVNATRPLLAKGDTSLTMTRP